MRDFIRKFATLFIALSVLLTGGMAAFAGGAAADVTSDGDIEADSTQADFEADDNNRTITYETDNNTDTLDDFDELSLDLDSADGHDLAEYDIDDAEITSGDDDDTTPATVEWTVNDEDLEQLAGDAGTNVTVDYAIDELMSGDEEPLTDEGSYEYTFTDGHATALVTDDSAESEEIEADTLSSFSMGYFGQSEADLFTYEDSVGIEGDNTTVTVFDTSDGAEEVDDRLEDAEDGDLIKSVAVGDGDSPIPSFYGEVDEDRVDAEEDTYAVYLGDGEWEFHLGDDYEDETEFDFVIETQSYADSDYDKAAMSEVFIDSLEVNALGEFGWMDAFNTFGFDAFSTFELGDLNPF